MKGMRRAVAATLAMLAVGSGGPPPVPDYVTSYALNAVDLSALSGGHLGILKAAAPSPILYLDWRLLNGLAVGKEAGAALAKPCCGDSSADPTYRWIDARRQVPGASTDIYYISTEREGPNYTTIPTCFSDAFVTATVTLKDRIGRYGASSPGVRAWLAGQDAVFQSCSKPGVVLPALAVDAPAWLRADRAYQEAALALYDGRYADAERGFAAIGKDRHSPWQPKALYLQARVALRSATVHLDAPGFAHAHAAIRQLGAAPSGSYGQDQIPTTQQLLLYREHPRELLARLDHDLNQHDPAPDIAVKFKDYLSLSDVSTARPEAGDWIRTLQAKDRKAGLAHAQQQWSATHHVAWLAAALSLAMPDDAAAPTLARDAAAVAPDSPAWLTTQYHLTRLTLLKTPLAETRSRTDAILARNDLTSSDRNIFSAIRTQLSTGLDDFVRHALRQPYCTATDGGCVPGNFPAGDGLIGKQGASYVGLGGDARAVIDRLPLKERMALAQAMALPRELRLDIALTDYARAVQLQDDAAIDATATQLADLLPQVRDDWRAIVRLRPGPDRRFAEFFVMAKIPSLRSDLAGYSRPEGKEPEFSGYWVDWMLLPRGHATVLRAFPPTRAYTPDEYWSGNDDEAPDGADMACFGKCGRGIFAFHMPVFAGDLFAKARAERGFFLAGDGKPDRIPPDATSLWGEMLDYARLHPKDPRTPETLYRLIRVARWGGNHDHLGKRAFLLLHARYPRSVWATKSPYYYDS